MTVAEYILIFIVTVIANAFANFCIVEPIKKRLKKNKLNITYRI